jgi:hypothetical protein
MQARRQQDDIIGLILLFRNVVRRLRMIGKKGDKEIKTGREERMDGACAKGKEVRLMFCCDISLVQFHARLDITK